MNKRAGTSKPRMASAGLFADAGPDIGSWCGENLLTLGLFHVIERSLLVVIVGETLVAVAFRIGNIYRPGTHLVAHMLLMFLYLEVIGMVSVHSTQRSSVVVYPTFSAIKAYPVEAGSPKL